MFQYFMDIDYDDFKIIDNMYNSKNIDFSYFEIYYLYKVSFSILMFRL